MKLRRLTLLRPNIGDYRSTDALPPLSMAVLAARTPGDVEIRFFDDKIESIPLRDDPDLLAMTVETFTARRAYAVADRYRARGIPVVLGGHHPTLLPEEALEHADAVVRGDAEGSWERLLADFQAGRLRRTYSGGNARPLDDVVLDREIFRGKRYAPVDLVQYGRGCRFVCEFCSVRAFYGDGPRLRPSEHVAEELRALGSRKLVFFVDDNLYGSRSALENLLDVLEPLKIRWSCQVSIDVARDERLLDRMADAGCVIVVIGFESLSESNLEQMRKSWNLSAGDYRSVVRRFHARGIGVYGTFVFGYDRDTTETIRRALDFALEARLEMANFNPLTPTPGSRLYTRLLEERRLLSEKWWLDPRYRYGDPIFVPRSMDPEEFGRECFEAKKRFYAWSSIATRVLAGDAGFDWFRTGMVSLANLISRKEVIRKQHRTLGE